MNFLESLVSIGLGIIIFIIGIYLAIYLAFLATLRNALREVSEQNRTMQPGQVYLLLIPIFNIIWCFFVVEKIAQSLKLEFEQRGIVQAEKPTYSIGLAYAIFSALALFSPLFLFLASIVGFAGFVCFIAYWISVSSAKNRLSSTPKLTTKSSNYTNTSGYNNSTNSFDSNNGYDGGYSGGHNSSGVVDLNRVNSMPNQSNNPSVSTDTEYKSGNLYN